MTLSKHGTLPMLLGLCGHLLVLQPALAQIHDGRSYGSQRPGTTRLASTVATPPTEHDIRLAAGLLSVKVQDVQLIQLLGEVARLAGFTVAPCFACGQTISLQFDRLPLDQGLSLILKDQNFVLKWKQAATASKVPHQLWILPQPRTRQVARPMAPARQDAEREPATVESQASRLRSTLAVGTPDDREQAATALGQQRDADTMGALTRALADSDADVRRAAIESLAEIKGAEAAVALGLALGDADPRIREAAVNALGDVGGPQVIALLRQAQRDPTAFVRQAAIETLEDLQGPGR